MRFLADENQKRSEDYRKDSVEEDFLSRFNGLLSTFEEQPLATKSQMPWVFVVGLPRSGTTLLMQLLATAFDFAYINNFIARFWDAPLTGARLNKILKIGHEYKSSFNSDYGKSEQIEDVHEWSYFWIKNLNYQRSEEFNRKENSTKINWNYVAKILFGMSSIADKPFLCKALHQVKYAKEFYSLNKQILFIHITRDLKDVCQSNLEARLKYYNNPNTWWSIIPDNYKDLQGLQYHQQIPEQMLSLQNEINEDLAVLDEQNKIQLTYEHLCQIPHFILKQIQNKLQAFSKKEFLLNLDHIPTQLKQRKRTAYDQAMLDYLNSKR